MIERLHRSGVEVIECHERLWYGIEDRVQAARGGLFTPSFLWRVLCTYYRLIQRYKLVGDYDVLLVGYPGQLDVLLARLLSWKRRKPLVWDILMSIYLIALDRGIPERLLSMKLIRWLEQIACHLPDLLILDTQAYVAWFQSTYGVSPDHFRLVPLGADDSLFKPIVSNARAHSNVFRVIYYGTFIPNHGVQYIVEAARLLAEDTDIQFELIGIGPDREQAVDQAKRHGLTNITFVDWLDQAELVEWLSRADVCLGSFGLAHQSMITVHNKIYEGLAMGKPVITGDSPAVRELFQHGKHVYLCKRGDAQSLAESIRVLHKEKDLCQSLSRQGYAYFQECFSMGSLSLVLQQHLTELVNKPTISMA